MFLFFSVFPFFFTFLQFDHSAAGDLFIRKNEAVF